MKKASSCDCEDGNLSCLSPDELGSYRYECILCGSVMNESKRRSSWITKKFISPRIGTARRT